MRGIPNGCLTRTRMHSYLDAHAPNSLRIPKPDTPTHTRRRHVSRRYAHSQHVHTQSPRVAAGCTVSWWCDLCLLPPTSSHADAQGHPLAASTQIYAPTKTHATFDYLQPGGYPSQTFSFDPIVTTFNFIRMPASRIPGVRKWCNSRPRF